MDIVQEDLDRGARYRFDWKTANVKGLSEPRLPSRGAFRCEYDENVIVVIDFAPGKGLLLGFTSFNRIQSLK